MGLAWCLLVLEKKYELTTPPTILDQGIHLCQREIKISPSAIKKKHQNGSSLVSVCPREKVRINDPPFPTILGQGIHLCRRKSKFHLRSLRKSTKMGLAWCPLFLEKKCELTTPHNFGPRNPSVSTEIKITPSAIKKKHQNGYSLVSVGPREKVQIKDPPQFRVKESICVDGNQNFTFCH